MAELKKFVHRRKSVRAQVTKSFNSVETFESLSCNERSIKLSLLTEFRDNLSEFDDLIQKSMFSEGTKFTESDLDAEIESCTDYRIKLLHCIAYLTKLNESDTASQSRRSQANTLDITRSLLKQPVAPLPKYSGGENEDLIKFFREFEMTTSSYNYPDRDLLLLLRQQVSGRALTILNSLETDKQTFQDAKTLLVSAFASPELRMFSTINKLTKLKLSIQDDPFDFISKVKGIAESVNALDIKTCDFLQYFVWQSMNEKFKSYLIQITGKTRPSFKEIVDNFFTANERYANALKNEKDCVYVKGKEFAVNSLAVAVKSKFVLSNLDCVLCNKNGHTVFRCQEFKTPREKLDRLQALKRCTRCLNHDHQTKDCSFQFKRKCRHCSKWHYDFLCVPQAPSLQTLPKQPKRETSNNIAVLPSMTSKTILPTFSFNSLGSCRNFRGIKDNCSQSTFITEETALVLKLKIVKDNVDLLINGFNGPMSYKSKKVQLPLVTNSGTCHILAMVVPDIKVNLKLPRLGRIASSFISKGYQLADSFLNKDSNSISNLDLLLGADALHCIPGKEVCFGKGKSSIYVETPMGIMLTGNIESLEKDLPYLPPLNELCNEMSVIDNSLDVGTNSPKDIFFNTHSFLVSGILDSNSDTLDFDKLNERPNIESLHWKDRNLDKRIDNATCQILEEECKRYTNYDCQVYNDEYREVNDDLIDYTLCNLKRCNDGRIEIPLLWNAKVKHLLAKNQNLAKAILDSNYKKLIKNPGNLKLMDTAIKEQVDAAIIEKIENLQLYLDAHPEHSFLPHMGIFKLGRETTKCRIVFLSNLSERLKGRPSISHNQAIYAGPTLNQKLSSALLQLRFGKHLLTYDLKKAFNQLALSPSDQSKLLFLWYRNVDKNDFSVVAYKNVRLSFGLRCSPFLLMISLFQMLVLDSVTDPSELRNLKTLMYSLLYMDNGAISADSEKELCHSYVQLPHVFSPYKFEVQQLTSNNIDLQNQIDRDNDRDTPDKVKLLGLTWDRLEDSLTTGPINLNAHASTKRSILSTIAAQFDVYNFNLPILNRSRVFMHNLQCDKSLNWDDQLSQDLLREWKNICKQANSSPEIKVKRFVGARSGTYKLLAFTDASHLMYGIVVYILNVDSGDISFIMAKNRLVNNQLKLKSIPSLEFNAISLGVETLIDIHRDLSGPGCLNPINICEMHLYTDSICCLHWLNSYSHKLDKMQKQSAFIMNRLKRIEDLCERFPIAFHFVSGRCNPADCVTRCVSHKVLSKSNFLKGPNLESLDKDLVGKLDIADVILPNPFATPSVSHDKHSCAINVDRETSAFATPSVSHDKHSCAINVDRETSASATPSLSHDKHSCAINVASETSAFPSPSMSVFLIDPTIFSSFKKLVLLHRRVLVCVERWKERTGIGKSGTWSNSFAEASRQIILSHQMTHFSDILEYFSQKQASLKEIPPSVAQLNVFMDEQGLLRVKSKFRKMPISSGEQFPIFLANDSPLTELIISDIHMSLAHSGCYSVLAELRKKFFINKPFSTVKKCLRKCVHCKRFNARTIKLNQSSYRDFRTEPPKVPFNNIFIDHLGPISVKKNGQTCKIWILCLTCTWSRAINLKICHDLSVKEFLRAFQLHAFEFGIPQLCISDLGSQLTAGANLITDFLNESETLCYFQSQNIKPLAFQHYFKGCSELGSLVEVCVKLTKRLIFGSIKNNVLDYFDFEFLLSYVVHLANRRPIAFKEALRDDKHDSVPDPITPEHLLRGYELTSINIIPDLQGHTLADPDWNETPTTMVKDSFKKLRKVRADLLNIYQEEFLATLTAQAVDRKDRFRKVSHSTIKVGDIVLLKEVNVKPNNFPLAIVKHIVTNDIGEVTGAVVLKGKTRELVKRHSSTLIPILEAASDCPEDLGTLPVLGSSKAQSPKLPARKAAIESRRKFRDLLKDL